MVSRKAGKLPPPLTPPPPLPPFSSIRLGYKTDCRAAARSISPLGGWPEVLRAEAVDRESKEIYKHFSVQIAEVLSKLLETLTHINAHTERRAEMKLQLIAVSEKRQWKATDLVLRERERARKISQPRSFDRVCDYLHFIERRSQLSTNPIDISRPISPRHNASLIRMIAYTIQSLTIVFRLPKNSNWKSVNQALGL